jgi:hypothetical protein
LNISDIRFLVYILAHFGKIIEGLLEVIYYLNGEPLFLKKCVHDYYNKGEEITLIADGIENKRHLHI